MLKNKYTQVLLGITVGAILALLVVPQTRWLTAFPATIAAELPIWHGTLYDDRVKQVAAAHPNDFNIQYAVLNQIGGASQLQEMESLQPKFPNNPALLANILEEASSKITVNYNAAYLAFAPASSRQQINSAIKEQGKPKANDPALLTLFIKDAETGEQVDPSNAFFSMMMAVGEYAQNNNKAAQSAILRAGSKPQWNEYLDSEILGTWQLHKAVFGFNEAISQLAVYASKLDPQYVQLDYTVRRATYDAMQYEQAGQFQKGIALRQALIRTGELLRDNAKPLIGSSVGISMNIIAMTRPGGAPVGPEVKQQTAQENEKRTIKMANAYAIFLRAHHDSADAAQALAVVTTDYRARQLMLQYDNNNLVTVVMPLMKWLMVTALILANLLWLLALGLAVKLRTRLRAGTVSGQWKSNAAVGAALFLTVAAAVVFTLPVFALIAAAGQDPQSSIPFQYLIILSAFVAPLAVMGIGLLRIKQARMSRTISAALAPAMCVALLVYGGVVVGTAQREQAAQRALTQNLLQGEAKYVAQQTGQAWPVAVG